MLLCLYLKKQIGRFSYILIMQQNNKTIKISKKLHIKSHA